MSYSFLLTFVVYETKIWKYLKKHSIAKPQIVPAVVAMGHVKNQDMFAKLLHNVLLLACTSEFVKCTNIYMTDCYRCISKRYFTSLSLQPHLIQLVCPLLLWEVLQFTSKTDDRAGNVVQCRALQAFTNNCSGHAVVVQSKNWCIIGEKP